MIVILTIIIICYEKTFKISGTLVLSWQLREKFINIRSKLSELSECQAIILGNQYDLQHVTDILRAIDKRQELWKYCDVSSHTIREWLQTVFKKVCKFWIQILTYMAYSSVPLKSKLPPSLEMSILSWEMRLLYRETKISYRETTLSNHKMRHLSCESSCKSFKKL